MPGVNGTVDIIHNGSTGISFWRDPWNRSVYQTFVMPWDGTQITDIWVKLKTIWADPRTTGAYGVVAEIYATSNNQPTGSAIAQGSGVFAGRPGADFEILRVSPSFNIVDPGAKYAVVLSIEADAPLRTNCEWAVAPVYDDLGFGQWSATAGNWEDKSNLGNGWLQLAVRDAENTIDVTHDSTSGFTFGQVQGVMDRTFALKCYQTFIAKNNQPIEGVDLKLRRSSSGMHSDVIVELYGTYDHRPGAGPLAAAVIPASSIGTDWTVVNAPLYFPKLSFGEEYAVVLSHRTVPMVQPGRYEWAVGNANRALSFGRYNGTSWIDESGRGDGWMRVRVIPPGRISAAQETTPMPERAAPCGFGDATNEIKLFQSFSLSGSATIVGADVMIRKCGGSTQSDVLAELYKSSGGLPTGPILARAKVPSDDVGIGFGWGEKWVIAHIPLESTALPAGDYALVLSQVSPRAAHYEWALNWEDQNHKFGRWDRSSSSWVDESVQGTAWIRVWETNTDTLVEVPPQLHPPQPPQPVNGPQFGNDVDQIKRFQTFRTPPLAAGEMFSLNGVQLTLKRHNAALASDQSDVIVELYPTDPADISRPAEHPMAKAVVPSWTIGSDWTVVDVPLSYGCDYGRYCIAPDTTYAIALTQRTHHAACYEWRVTRSHWPYPWNFGKWDGLKWTDQSRYYCGWLTVSLQHMPTIH